jgi:hypothetical protein
MNSRVLTIFEYWNSQGPTFNQTPRGLTVFERPEAAAGQNICSFAQFDSGNINLDYEIITDFYISLQFYHNIDGRSPGTNEPNGDCGFVAGLRYKF